MGDDTRHITGEARILHDLLTGRRALRTMFQPLVSLDDGSVIGYEALTRGPQGSRLESAPALFGAAAEAGVLGELCVACQTASMRNAEAAGLADGHWLFVNMEPAGMARHLPDASASAAQGMRLVAEITERALTDAPAEVLRTVRQLRELGWVVALDDVGAHAGSLAMLPVLRPDVVKLDRSIVQNPATAHAIRVAATVNAYAEASGACVLAEGVEDDEHLLSAVTLGATVGQGWLFGHPVPTPDGEPAEPAYALRRTARNAPDARSPFEHVTLGRAPRRGSFRVLTAMSHYLEQQARQLGEGCVIATSFEHAGTFDDATRCRYAELAESASFVAVLGPGMPEQPAPGVRGARLASGDPLRREWTVAVLGPHFAGALVAREVGRSAVRSRRSFEYALSYDESVVADVVAALLGRVRPRSSPHPAEAVDVAA